MKFLIVAMACISMASCTKSGSSQTGLSSISNNMGTTNTGNALQPLELVVGISGQPPVTGNDGLPLASTQELITTWSPTYDPTIGAGWCSLTDYKDEPFCVNNTCANNANPGMCYAQNACLSDARMLAGTVSIGSDKGASPAPSAQCVTNGTVYFLKLTVYANYNREYFISPTPEPMVASGSYLKSCLERMGHFYGANFTDYGNIVSPPDNGNGYVTFACTVDPSNSSMGSFTIRYCQNSTACATY